MDDLLEQGNKLEKEYQGTWQVENVIEHIRLFNLAAVDIDRKGTVNSLAQGHLTTTHVHGDDDQVRRENSICKRFIWYSQSHINQNWYSG